MKKRAKGQEIQLEKDRRRFPAAEEARDLSGPAMKKRWIALCRAEGLRSSLERRLSRAGKASGKTMVLDKSKEGNQRKSV